MNPDLLAQSVDLYNREIAPEDVRTEMIAIDAFLDVSNRYYSGQVEESQWRRALRELWEVMGE